MIGGHSPLPRRGVQRVVIISERPREVAVEDIARGKAQGAFQVDGGLGLDTRPAVGVGHHDFLDRFGQNRIQRCQHRVGEPAPHALGIGGLQFMRYVQPEHRQGRRPGVAQFGRQDARVGQRVAVDLTRQRRGHLTGYGGRVGGVQLRPRLVDVEGAAEGLLARDGGILQPR